MSKYYCKINILPKVLIKYLFDYIDYESIIIFFKNAMNGISWNCKEKNKDVVEWLCLKSLDTKTKPVIGYVFTIICEHGYIDIAEQLYKKYSYLEGNFNCALYYTCQMGHVDMVNWLIDISTKNNIVLKYEDALCMTCQYGHMEIFNILTKKNINTSIHIYDDEPFVLACAGGHLNIAMKLFSMGSNIHVRHEKPLHEAYLFGHYDIIKWLLGMGADIKVLYEKQILDIIHKIGIGSLSESQIKDVTSIFGLDSFDDLIKLTNL